MPAAKPITFIPACLPAGELINQIVSPNTVLPSLLVSLNDHFEITPLAPKRRRNHQGLAPALQLEGKRLELWLFSAISISTLLTRVFRTQHFDLAHCHHLCRRRTETLRSTRKRHLSIPILCCYMSRPVSGIRREADQLARGNSRDLLLHPRILL